MAPPAAAPGPMMAPPPMPPMVGEQEVMSAAQQGAMEGEQLGAQLGAEYMANMDSAIDSAETPLEMINAIRGNERPLEARYSELAEYVGEEDARETPETVLALVQPFMMMTEQGAVDSGIGELMQNVVGDQEMPDEGPMTEGVGGLMTAGAGNTPPRNFRDGGAVRRFNVGGDVTLDSNTGPGRTSEYFPQYQQLYSQILGSDASRQEQLQESKDMAQAQMFFDIAQAGLQFAGETEGNTVAERLANAARKSEVLPRISQSAASILKAKQDYQAEKRSLDLAALGAANAEASRALGEEAALMRAIASKTATTRKPEYKRLVGPDGNDLGTFNIEDPEQRADFEAALKENPGAKPFNMSTEPTADQGYETITLYDPKDPSIVITMPVNTPAEKAKVNEKLTTGGLVSDDTRTSLMIKQEFEIAAEERATAAEQNRYERNRADELTDQQTAVDVAIAAEQRALGRALTAEERTNVEYRSRLDYQVTLDVEAEQRALGRTLKAEERANAEARARKALDETYRIDAEQRALANEKPDIRVVDGQVLSVDARTGKTIELFGEKKPEAPNLVEVSLPNEDGVPVTSYVDLNTPAGQAALSRVNEITEGGGTASVSKISTSPKTPRGFRIEGKGIFTSYDGGVTYLDKDGSIQMVPGGSFEVSNTVAADVARTEKLTANANKQLLEMDAQLIANMGQDGINPETGKPYTAQEQAEVMDAYKAARIGTGFWSNVRAGIDAVGGGLTSPEAFNKVFKDTQEARKFVKMVRVLGRSALAVSPRFAVADLQSVEQLLPSEKYLGNPQTEAQKLATLSGYIDQQKRRILTEFASGVPIDDTIRRELSQKLFEINRLQEMLGPLASTSESSKDAIQSAKDTMRSNVKKPD